MPQKNRLRAWIFAGCLCLSLYFFGVAPLRRLFQLTGPHWDTLVDFEVFYKAGVKAFQHHTVYDVTDHWQYKYSPLIAYLFGITLCRFDFHTAQILFTLGLMVLWPLFLAWTLITYERKIFKDSRLKFLEKIGLLLFFYGNSYLRELHFGQVNLLPFSLLFAFFSLYPKGPNPKPSPIHWLRLITLATLWSVAIQIKLFSAIIGAFLLFRKEFKLLATTLVVTIGLDVLLLAGVHGWQFALSENLAWITTLTASSQTLLTGDDNGSLLGIMSRGLPLQSMATLGWILLIFGYLGIQYQVRNFPPLINLALNLLAILLLNPLVWNYWTIFSFPAFLIVVHALQVKPLLQQNHWIQAMLCFLLFNHLTLFTWVSKGYGHPIAHTLLFIVFVQLILRQPKRLAASI